MLEYREFFANDDKILPDERGRYWMRTYTNKANSWLVYSNDGLIFYTYDNGKTFYPCYVSEDFISNLDDTKLIYPSKDYETKYQEVLDKFPPYLYDSDWQLEDKLNAIKEAFKDVIYDKIRSWSNKDALSYGINREIYDDYSIKEKYCKEWITAYKEVIKMASEICDIPSVLLAGTAWIEVGGMFTFMDHLAYVVREYSIIAGLLKDSELTSFGHISMQVRRISEILREDLDNLNDKERYKIIGIAENALTNIFLTAQHLSDLRNVDFPGKTANELKIEDIIVIANRFNIGPNHDMNIASKHDYGYRIIDAMEMLLELLE